MASAAEPTSPAPTRNEEFVEKQIARARSRIRYLDLFAAGLVLLAGSLAFLIAVLLVDRYAETPRGTGWAALGLYLLGAAGYLYWSLFRPSRRHINPLYAARQVEREIPDAKNSVVNYLDLQDEPLPASVRAAVGTRAARDLKKVDVLRAIHPRHVAWLAAVAGGLFLGAVVVYFLPPTRTELRLVEPKGGNVTILNTQDLRIEANVTGRVPRAGDRDAPRVRLVYEDGTDSEPRLEPVPEEKNRWGITLPAAQLRGKVLHYKVLAGNAETPQFEVVRRVLPLFTGFEVKYEYPEYLNRPAETTTDATNLVAYYGTQVTLTARTTRQVKDGYIQVESPARTIPGTVNADDPQALRFVFPLEAEGHYRIWFTTVEGEQNTDPPRFAMKLMDPKPLFVKYEVAYDYPEYLRWKPQRVSTKEPNVEAMRGTRVTITAQANRPVREGRLQIDGQDKPILGERVKDQPMRVKFTLPPLEKDGAYKVSFSPGTKEKDSDPKGFTIKVNSDQPPQVTITQPDKEEIQLPANGNLAVEGLATDDFGLTGMTLRMQVVEPRPVPLKGKPYREGKSFLRKSDNSYPTKLEYKDFVDLGKLKAEAGGDFPLRGGELVEYWLEAVDNCAVKPGPNVGYSVKKRVRILPPQNQQQQDKQRQNLQKNQQNHEQKQDKKLDNEQRDPNQPQPKGGDNGEGKKDPDQQPKQDPNQQPKKDGSGGQDPNQQPKQDPNQQPKQDPNQQPKQDPNGGGKGPNEQNLENQARQVQDKLNQPPDKGTPKPNNQPQNDGERQPASESKPDGQNKQEPRGENKPQQSKPDQPPDGAAGENKQQGQVEQPPPKAEDKPQGQNQSGDGQGEPKNQPFGGAETGKPKPQGKPDMQPNPKKEDGGGNPMQEPKANPNDPNNAQPKENPPGAGKGRGSDKPQPKSGQGPMNGQNPEPKANPEDGDRQGAAPGQSKPDQKADRGSGKPQQSEPNQPGSKEPSTGQAKADKSPQPAEVKNQPKNNDPNAGPQGEPKPNVAQNGPNAPKEGEPKPEPKKDPANNGTGQVARGQDKPEQPKPEPGAGAGQAKPGPKSEDVAKNPPAQDKKPPQNPDGQSAAKPAGGKSDQPNGEPKPQQSPERVANNQPGANKPQPKNDPGNAGQQKPEGKGDAQASKGQPKPGEPKGEQNSGQAKGSGQPKRNPEDIKKLADKIGQMAKDLQSNDPMKKQDAENRFQEMMKQAADQMRKGGNGKKGDPKKDDTISDEEIKKLAEELKKQDPETRQKVEDLVKKMSQDLRKKAERQAKEGPKGDDVAKQGPDGEGKPEGTPPAVPKSSDPGPAPGGKTDVGNPSGKGRPDRVADGSSQQPQEGTAADLRNKIRAGELLLKNFRESIKDKKFQQDLKWTPEEQQRFASSYENQLKRWKERLAQMEKSGQADARTGPSQLPGGPERIKLDPKVSGDPLQGGRYAPPPGYADPFKEFTESISGVRTPKK